MHAIRKAVVALLLTAMPAVAGFAGIAAAPASARTGDLVTAADVRQLFGGKWLASAGTWLNPGDEETGSCGPFDPTAGYDCQFHGEAADDGWPTVGIGIPPVLGDADTTLLEHIESLWGPEDPPAVVLDAVPEVGDEAYLVTGTERSGSMLVFRVGGADVAIQYQSALDRPIGFRESKKANRRLADLGRVVAARLAGAPSDPRPTAKATSRPAPSAAPRTPPPPTPTATAVPPSPSAPTASPSALPSDDAPTLGWWSGTITVTTDVDFFGDRGEGTPVVVHGPMDGELVISVMVDGDSTGAFWTNELSGGANLISQHYVESRDYLEPVNSGTVCAGNIITRLGPANGGPVAIVVTPGGLFSVGGEDKSLTAVSNTASGFEGCEGARRMRDGQRWYDAFGWCGGLGDEELGYFTELPDELTQTVREDVDGVPTEVLVNRTRLVYTCDHHQWDNVRFFYTGTSTVTFDLRFGDDADRDADGVTNDIDPCPDDAEDRCADEQPSSSAGACLPRRTTSQADVATAGFAGAREMSLHAFVHWCQSAGSVVVNQVSTDVLVFGDTALQQALAQILITLRATDTPPRYVVHPATASRPGGYASVVVSPEVEACLDTTGYLSLVASAGLGKASGVAWKLIPRQVRAAVVDKWLGTVWRARRIIMDGAVSRSVLDPDVVFLASIFDPLLSFAIDQATPLIIADGIEALGHLSDFCVTTWAGDLEIRFYPSGANVDGGKSVSTWKRTDGASWPVELSSSGS